MMNGLYFRINTIKVDNVEDAKVYLHDIRRILDFYLGDSGYSFQQFQIWLEVNVSIKERNL